MQSSSIKNSGERLLKERIASSKHNLGRDNSSVSSESVVFSVFPLVRESDMKNDFEVNRAGSNYRRRHTPGSGISPSALKSKSSVKTASKQCDTVVDDFKLEDQIKHVTIRDTAEVLEFRRDGE